MKNSLTLIRQTAFNTPRIRTYFTITAIHHQQVRQIPLSRISAPSEEFSLNSLSLGWKQQPRAPLLPEQSESDSPKITYPVQQGWKQQRRKPYSAAEKSREN